MTVQNYFEQELKVRLRYNYVHIYFEKVCCVYLMFQLQDFTKMQLSFTLLLIHFNGNIKMYQSDFTIFWLLL